jgi:hypothetical protein
MPTKPPRGCRRCGGLIYGSGPCACAPKPYERFSPAERDFYSSSAWTAASKRVRAEEPLCDCDRPSEVVDHRVPLTERWDLRLVRENLKARCRSCHSKKQAAVKAGTWRDPIADELRARRCASHPNLDDNGVPASCWRCKD